MDMEPPDSEQVVKRLFTIAAILLRKPSEAPAEPAASGENDPENHDSREMGYCEPEDRS